MGILSGNPKEEPLHSGEVFYLWTHLFETKAFLVTLQVLTNHTGDHDLKLFLGDLKDNCLMQGAEQVETIVKEAGIRLPPAPPDRPNVEVQDIPAGARFNDPEIAAMVLKEVNGGMLLASTIMGISIRKDITELYRNIHTQLADYAAKLLDVNKDKGWIVPPPLMVK
ncbi:hypothetical protein JOC77_002835 [Peribacillus deserti]|uniref:DUF3231 domain-containing protein n=1 Tax=Peribacillus deserti TaxID=673318 RepID=A0ABS2QJP6_9BACI|nr:DUF3231 family protein [Peribacillus deserti]MBM7693395.1 hypothetical protein [Peribacillus deserti]